MADVTVKSLLEAGVHFGHQTQRWNPKMGPYLFGQRSGVHIIDLEQTLGYIHEAQAKVKEVTANGGTILFVGTKRQGKEALKAAAKRAEMPYVNERWLGGMLTNWNTISERLRRYQKMEEELNSGDWQRLPKKEIARKTEELNRLKYLLGGIKDLKKIPDLVFVNDIVREDLAVAEARKLKIPVIGVADSNANPNDADYVIPGNDDAIRAISIVADAIADAAAAGHQEYLKKAPETPAEAPKKSTEPAGATS